MGSNSIGHKGSFSSNTEDRSSNTSKISRRAVVTSMIGLVLMISYLQYSELTMNVPVIDNRGVPSVGGLLFVVILLLLNMLTRKVGRKLSFSEKDIVVMYIVISFGGFLGSWGLMGVAMGNIAALPILSMQNPDPYRGLLDNISSLVTITDPMIARGFWVGGSTVPWKAWIMPAVSWGLFWFMLLFSFISIVTIVRKRWTDGEHLLYPLTTPVISVVTGRLDLQGKDAGDSIWRNKLFWIGTVPPIVITILSFIHSYVPVAPVIPTQIDLGRFFTEKPWSALQEWPNLVLSLRPIGIGIGYMLRSEIVLSVWLFYLVQKVSAIPLEAVGQVGLYNAFRYGIGRGAFIGIALYYLWLVRGELALICRRAFGGKGVEAVDDSNEPLSYRTAFFGGILGFVFMVLFSVYLLKMTLLGVLSFFVIVLGVAVGFARLRAEAGVPTSAAGMEFGNNDPSALFGKGFGTANTMGVTLYYNPLGNGYFSSVPAYLLESYKLADEVCIERRSITKMLLLTFVVTFVVSLAAGLPIAYNYGMFNLTDFNRVHGMHCWAHTIGSQEPELRVAYSYGIGFVFAVILMWFKTSFVWWPLHPLGFAIGTGALQMDHLMGSFDLTFCKP